MAIFHFHVGQISRGKGQSIVASAAYRAGEKLHDDYYGEIADYTAKGGVVVSEIILPAFVPEEYKDREFLWNEVEKVEKHPKAQLAYSFDIALMNELTMEENIELAKRFVKENLVFQGMIADIAVHNPEKDGIENPHFHVLCPIRPMNEDGIWGEKQRREYLVNEEGKPILDEKGKQKFNAVQTTDWGLSETLDAWRKAWDELVNETLATKGLSITIDHRSYAEQGIDLIPQVHEGPHVRQMEAKGIRTEKGDLNRLIKEINDGIKALKAKIKNIMAKISDLSDQIKEVSDSARQTGELSLEICLVNYFDERNEKANSYAYGMRKAKVTNVKQLSSVLLSLKRNNITTIDELLAYANEKRGEVRELGRSNNVKGKLISELKENIRYFSWYEEGLPIMKQVCKTKFTKRKEAIKSENSDTIQRYQIAKRILSERKLLGSTDVSSLSKKLQELESGVKNEYEQYKKMSKDIKVLEDICSYAQKAMKPELSKKREVKR